MAKIVINENTLRQLIRNILHEAVDELNLYHGTHADFDKFDVAYLSTGWGQQAHGYGFYLTDCYEAAKDYSCGGHVMEVKVPDGKYLSDEGISPEEAENIADTFFTYYTEELDYGKEAYPDAQARRDFWDYEVSCISRCDDGAYVYGTVASLLGSNEDASNFLHDKLGYVGITIHTKHGETGEPITTYVIFSPNDIEILNKDVVNEEIDTYNPGDVEMFGHPNKELDAGVGKYGIFRLSPALMSCIYEAAFQLLGYERFAIDGEMVFGNKTPDNPWDEAYHVLKWAIENGGLDASYLGRISKIYSNMSDDEFNAYSEQVENGQRFWFSKEELAEIFKTIPDGMKKILVRDMLNVGRIGKIKETVRYLKRLNGGKNLDEFLEIIRNGFRNGNIPRGGIDKFREPVTRAMQTTLMLGSGK